MKKLPRLGCVSGLAARHPGSDGWTCRLLLGGDGNVRYGRGLGQDTQAHDRGKKVKGVVGGSGALQVRTLCRSLFARRSHGKEVGVHVFLCLLCVCVANLDERGFSPVLTRPEALLSRLGLCRLFTALSSDPDSVNPGPPVAW